MRRWIRLVVLGCLCAGSCSPPAGPDLTEADRKLAAGDYAGAAAILETRHREDGPRTDVMMRLGRAYEGQGEFGRAVASYKSGLEAHPEARELWLALANVYLDLAQYEPARDAYGRARSAGAADTDVSLSLGMCLGRLGDLDGAEVEFRRASQAGMAAPLVDYNRAVVLMARGKFEEARGLLEEVLRAQPSLAIAQRELARALLAGGSKDPAVVSRAIELAWGAVQATPADWRSHDALGQGYLASGDWEAAMAAFTEALRLGGDSEELDEHYRQAEKMRRAAAKAPAR